MSDQDGDADMCISVADAARTFVAARIALKTVIDLAHDDGMAWPAIGRCLREGGLYGTQI